jgi:hypothetical protein
MKKFHVSIALKVPANFDIEVSARNKKEALQAAIDKYSKGKFDPDDVSEPFWEDAEIDIRRYGNELSGFYIAKK